MGKRCDPASAVSRARVIDEARPCRSFFPLGAPDHD
jgi:hypothetical protein